jgi:hypothetical protein
MELLLRWPKLSAGLDVARAAHKCWASARMSQSERQHRVGRAAVIFVLAAASGLAACEEREVTECSSSSSYQERIGPLLTTDRPDSCSACHASGVRLSDFVRGTECEAMACLKEQGLVNLDAPEESVLLSWIGRVPPESPLIDADVVAAEKTAFLDWFEHEARCGSCADALCPDAAVGGCGANDPVESAYDPTTDPGDCSQETLERLFRGSVFSWRGRCAPCHIDGAESAAAAPRFFFELGDCNVASLASLNRIVSSGLIDVEDPLQSLLLSKPLAEADGGVQHGGGDKIAADSDPAYAGFVNFLQRYGACQTP